MTNEPEDVPEFKTIADAVEYHHDQCIGNSWAEKFPTPESRKELAEAYMMHCRSGLSDESFVECDKRTFLRYATLYPEDMQVSELLKAQVERRRFWERMGTAGAGGKLKGFNSKAWEFNMMNRYRSQWKLRQDVTSDDEGIKGGYIIVPEKKPEGHGAITKEES